ncbi:hypothetical protein LPJ74_005331 [Coemansia sp. RSA 1843]|nr:hypothetical protein LPJ74_005331 [Coemansia sp. RSA 1843]
MGQTASSIPHSNAAEDQAEAQQQPAGSSSATDSRQRRGGRRANGGTDDTGGSSGGPRRRRNVAARYSPYANPTVSATQSVRQTPLSQSISAQNTGRDNDSDQEMGEMRRNAAQLIEAVLPMTEESSFSRTNAQMADANRHEDVEMADVDGGADTRSQNTSSQNPTQSASSSPRRQNRVRGGDLLLARIIGRSIVDAVARELEERGTALAAVNNPQEMDALRNGNVANNANFFSAPTPTTAPTASANASNNDASSATATSADGTTADSTQQQSATPESVLPMYNMGFTSRVALYRDVARFILSIIVSELGSANSSSANDLSRSNFESSIPLHIQAGPVAAQAPGTSAANTGNGPPENTTQENTPSSLHTLHQPRQPGAQQSTQQDAQPNVEEMMRNTRMHYRMFLLPDAIDQTLEHYEHYRNSLEQSRGAAGTSDDSSASREARSGNSDQTRDPRIIANLNSVIDSIDNATQASEALSLSEQATATTSGDSTAAHQSSRNELLRVMRQREREEKLRRLRSMVQAMSDERRYLPIPVVILGMHMSGELRQAISAGFNVRGSAGSQAEHGTADATGPSSSPSPSPSPLSTPSTANPHTTPSAPGHDDPGGGVDGEEHGLQGIFRGIRTRVGRIVPSIIDGLAAWRHGRSDIGATTANNAEVGGSNDNTGNLSTDSPAADGRHTAEGRSNSNNDTPMMSAYLTIQYTQLGNPLLLHIIASTLLSDMLGDTLADGEAGASQNNGTSGNNYEILTELSNIIGQVMSNTVSQDLVNKKLAKYRYEGIVGNEAEDDNQNADVVARLIEEGEVEEHGDHPTTVKLVSADRCPVCLEDFKVGETLRVLGCRHALHLVCGDSWFTQGSNMCPVCRAEAVSTLATPGAEIRN